MPVVSDNLVEQNTVSASGSVRADWLIRDIGRISAAFVVDFSRFLGGGPTTLAQSSLSGTFTRPLLRNAGFKRETESPDAGRAGPALRPAHLHPVSQGLHRPDCL